MRFVEELPLQEDAVLLEARNGKTIDGNIYYILMELLDREEYGSLKIYLVAEDEATKKTIEKKLGRDILKRVDILRIHTEEYYRIMASAKFLVSDASIANFFIKKEGQIYLNVWHGTPLKNMGRRVLHEPHATGNVQKNFIVADYLLYPSEYMMDHMIEDYMIANLSKADIIMGGYPRNSIFFQEGKRTAIRKELLGSDPKHEGPESMKIYAYMPTWRPGLLGGHLRDILAEMEEILDDDEVMLVSIHPLAEEDVDFSDFKRIRRFPQEYETYEVLNGADALLTDYSSVFYDFACTGRKTVLLTDDEEEYLSARGVYEPLDTLPFPRVKTAADAVSSLRGPKEYDDRAFLKKYCSYENADAARDLVAEVIGYHMREGGTSRRMEHRKMPSNGLGNILVYGGDLSAGERTDQVMEYLSKQDIGSANHYLTFRRKDLEDDHNILFDLPEGIDYIGRAGKMWLTKHQQDISDGYRKGKVDFSLYWETMKPALALQRLRNYGRMTIDDIVQIPREVSPGPEANLEELEFAVTLEKETKR